MLCGKASPFRLTLKITARLRLASARRSLANKRKSLNGKAKPFRTAKRQSRLYLASRKHKGRAQFSLLLGPYRFQMFQRF
jgi:hypothetical protein